MALYFRERTSNAEPSGDFTNDSGNDARTFVLADDENPNFAVKPQPSVVRAKIREALGGTLQWPAGPPGGPAGPGSINRIIPFADPMFPNLFADRIAIAPPRGEALEADFNADPLLAVTPIQGHALYGAHEFVINFSHRPYTAFPNERLTQKDLLFYDTDGTQKRLYHYEEWKRFTFKRFAAPDIRVSATQAGAMRFRAPGHAVDNTPLDSVPDMVVPDTVLTIEWYGVPIRYLSHPSSFLGNYVGFINQVEWQGWPAGSLLYMGYDVMRTYNQSEFIPAVVSPEQALGPNNAPVVDPEDSELAGTFGSNVCVDVALQFILTYRTAGVEIGDHLITNPNWLAKGHNLLPHFQTRKFFYATAAKDALADRQPSYFSIPHQILFQDPANASTVVPA